MRILVDDFHGHIAVQDLVVSAVDDAHSSFADFREDTATT
jgi:hypothetical protein